tara:strand:- start:570 stop:1451 length:882 start_codon:yes stop_codon:yes gene_type:complete
MDYILFNKGILPGYLHICINSILSVDKNAIVHLITDQETQKQNINIINLNDYKEPEFMKEFITNLKQNDMFDNPLWLTSLERIFYIENYIKENNINEFVHFDNDVVLFESFETLKNVSKFDDQGFYLTPLNSENMVFGYSYVNSNEDFFQVSSKAKKIIENYKYYSNKFNQNKPLNEMKIMSIIDRDNKNLIKSLDILPYGDKKLIFDPASYGQYLGGTHKKPKTFFRDNFATQAHYVGAELISKRITVKFKKNIPVVTSDLGDVSKLINLHIHSKKLKKFLPKVYKNYVSTF